MTEPLNLTHLRSLVAVVDRKSFTRAAQVLHLSQSTVSQHVRLLERKVGTDLIVREQRGVKLTPRGGEFVDRARGLLAEHDELVGDFAGTGPRRSRRRLSIGSTEHAADQVLPRLLTAFRRTFPGNELSFVLQRSTALIEAVRREDLDLAVTLAITPDAPGTKVGAMQLRWVADATLEVPEGGTTLPLVAFEDPCAIRARAFDLLGASGMVASVVAQSAGLDGVLSAVRAGLGLALLPIASDIPEGLRELPGLPPAGQIGVHVVSRDGLADTITYTALTMLSSFLITATAPAPVAAQASTGRLARRSSSAAPSRTRAMTSP
jgi:DNA-binding transcriptional LysR family regulator